MSGRAEEAAKALFAGLSPSQREKICFDWDFQDDRRGVLRNFAANHWQVTEPCVRGDFFSLPQQGLIFEVYSRFFNPDWYERVRLAGTDDTNGHPWGQDYSVAFIGNPDRGPWQFLITGRHLTLRTGQAAPAAAGSFGPIVYGHVAHSYWERAHHPGNVFWPQALAVSGFFARLPAAQQARAVVGRLPEESEIAFGGAPAGLSARLLSADQRDAFKTLLGRLMAMFAPEAQARLWHHLARQGGLDSLHVAVSAAKRISFPHWDVWRVEGPNFVWHFEGSPHVHAWVHVAEPGAEPAACRKGAFIFPGHDPLE